MHPRTHPTPEVDAGDDAGLGLVEVLIAMLVFAIVAVSVAYSLTFTLTTTKNTKDREVAVNLAAEEIDEVRSIGNPFAVLSVPRPMVPAREQVVGGVRFTINRETSWVNESGTDANCSASGGTLRYKRIKVTVDWPGSGAGAAPAVSETLLAPASRINDALKGTIFISVKGSNGAGLEGVTPTVSGTSGPAAEPTDAEGCSFVLGVTPGNYAVTIGGGFIDTTQASPSRVPVTGNLAVLAGQSTAFQFEVDRPGTFRTQYATNRSVLAGGTTTAIIFPPALKTNFTSTLAPFTKSAQPVDTTGTIKTAELTTSLFPTPAGYQAFAGDYTASLPSQPGCEVSDPAAWAADVSTSTTYIAQRGAGQSTTPSGTAAPIRVPMGVVQITRAATTTGSTATRTYLLAIRQAGPVLAGQPGCVESSPQTIQFGQVLPGSAAASTRVALPFGSWKLWATNTNTTSTSSNVTQLTSAAQATILSNVIPGRANADASGILTVDPRGITP
ncbi:type IV pilus modification PilV family protein [Agromyces aureus]|uniref:Prepilin-type N-terminal cleavage/methylation domain-containing protein n=1 Tax=Agromyces aureus TaxID=453304 RepID=A0A191WI62_9MICO|nr:hypothetical protein [Agromyces aureus]ANJ27907.1 hypothetical protein ATC03_15465 [Agromyces aureus]